MKFFNNKKYTAIALYAVAVFAVCLLLVLSVFSFSTIKSVFSGIIKVLSPIIWGLALAYLLNPLMMWFERVLTKLFSLRKKRARAVKLPESDGPTVVFIAEKKIHKRGIRLISVALTTVVTIATLCGLVAIVLPQLADSVLNIFNNMQTYFSSFESWVSKLMSDNPSIYQFINDEFVTLKQYVLDTVNKLSPQLASFVSGITAGAFSFLLGFKDFVLGFFLMVYLLSSKEKFQAGAKKVLYAFIPRHSCNTMFSVLHKSDVTFISFISGKALDSLIIGIICFIVMSLLGMPYIVLISFIVGVTNMIPFFGPFIGAIPSGLLILLSSPNKVVAFVIFIIILQQFDGNILGPKILGNSTGLPAFWVIFAIFVGGGMFGFAGMLVGVPVFAVFYTLFNELVSTRLKKKNLSVETEDYFRGRHPAVHDAASIMPSDIGDLPTDEQDVLE